MRIAALWVVVCVLLVPCAAAQSFEFPAAAVDDPEVLSKAMPRLAAALIEAVGNADADALFRLQMVAGRHEEAMRTLDVLSRHETRPVIAANYALHRLVAKTRAAKADEEFRTGLRSLDDRTSALVLRALAVSPQTPRRSLNNALQQQKGKSSIELADALALVRAYHVDEVVRTFGPAAVPLIAEEDQRRYVVERDIRIRTPEGATVCATVVRPRGGAQRLPSLLNFTIYNDPAAQLNEARRSASHGYAAVSALTRGKGCSPDTPVPYEHDGRDAAAVVDWIAAQPWSDGQVGMYGGSYEGFTPWAAAKQMPKALKAIMTGAPVAPGLDVPMEGNVFWNFVYPWTFYTTNNKTLDNETYNDNARWYQMSRKWYESGRAYRELEKIDGTPNPIFAKWLAHPSYDSYWQSMIPYGREFARVNIPVLMTAGYYYGGPGAATHYVEQHYKHRPNAEHYLVIGPYDHLRGHRGTIGSLGDVFDSLAGYTLDPVAQLDMGELRYEWFGYALKRKPKPALLKNRINYQVTGANVWKHAPSIAAMGTGTMRFYLDTKQRRLTRQKPRGHAFLEQTVDLADRSDIDQMPLGGGVVDDAVDTSTGFELASEPMPAAVEVSGLFSGRVEFITNKKDFDFNVALFERTAEGKYVQLSSYWTRASYVKDRSRRQLLTPGKRQRLDFRSIRLMSRLLGPGSRLVVVLGVFKEGGRQINYGSGKDVSDETIADAGAPLKIQWFDSSHIDVPTAER